jgi:hypothetical protein
MVYHGVDTVQVIKMAYVLFCPIIKLRLLLLQDTDQVSKVVYVLM